MVAVFSFTKSKTSHNHIIIARSSRFLFRISLRRMSQSNHLVFLPYPLAFADLRPQLDALRKALQTKFKFVHQPTSFDFSVMYRPLMSEIYSSSVMVYFLSPDDLANDVDRPDWNQVRIGMQTGREVSGDLRVLYLIVGCTARALRMTGNQVGLPTTSPYIFALPATDETNLELCCSWLAPFLEENSLLTTESSGSTSDDLINRDTVLKGKVKLDDVLLRGESAENLDFAVSGFAHYFIIC